MKAAWKLHGFMGRDSDTDSTEAAIMEARGVCMPRGTFNAIKPTSVGLRWTCSEEVMYRVSSVTAKARKQGPPTVKDILRGLSKASRVK